MNIPKDGQDIHSDDRNVTVYTKGHFFDNLQPLKNYSVVVTALNDNGWSHPIHPLWLSLDDSQNAIVSGLSAGAETGVSKSHATAVCALLVIVARMVGWK